MFGQRQDDPIARFYLCDKAMGRFGEAGGFFPVDRIQWHFEFVQVGHDMLSSLKMGQGMPGEF